MNRRRVLQYKKVLRRYQPLLTDAEIATVVNRVAREPRTACPYQLDVELARLVTVTISETSQIIPKP